MSTTTRPREDVVPTSSRPPQPAGSPPTREGGRLRPATGRAIGVGVVGLWLSLIVLLPLAAVVVRSTEGGWDTFWNAISSRQAVAALRFTLEVSLASTVINAVSGTLIAWVLVRDQFKGKRLVNAVIDLPFALPTIVAGLTLLALYGPTSPLGVNVAYTQLAVLLALRRAAQNAG